MKILKIIKLFLFLALTILIDSYLYSAPIYRMPKTIELPDKSFVHCLVSGDEFFNRLHDENDFTLIYGIDGYLYYAIKDGDRIKASQYRYKSVDPESVGIQPGIIISNELYQKIREKPDSGSYSSKSVTIPHTGLINNLVVFVRFSDQSEYADLRSYYNHMFNSTCDTCGSFRNFFYEVSYNQLTISSFLFPLTQWDTVVSYQDEHPRGYYMQFVDPQNTIGYTTDEEKAIRENTLVQNAALAISDQVLPYLDIDGDNNGFVDNMCFILKGDTDHRILWPHKANLDAGYDVYINGKKVSTYNIQVQEHLKLAGTKVLSHEMSHSIGFPDLYHPDDWWSLRAVAPWDIMDGGQNPPPHLCAYTKSKYGLWLSPPPVLESTGYYTLNPLNSASGSNVYFRINLPPGFSSQEYYIVEYRRKTGTFESSLPGSGMLIYRINPEYTGNHHYNGIDVFDEVYVYRPDGTTTQCGDNENANFSQLVGRTTINCSTNPPPFLTYGEPGDLYITDITDNNGTLTFLLIYNEPENLILSQPNTTGLYVAANTIFLEDGFNTTPSNSFRAITTKCENENLERYPHFEFIEVTIYDQTNQSMKSFSIQHEIGTPLDINQIRNKRDSHDNYPSPGTYQYVAKRDGIEIENGTIVIER